MPFTKKGEKRSPGAGRRAGTPNKSTANAREAIARFVDGNAERLQGWLEEIAEREGPKAAFECVLALLEFHVPKLARTELTGPTEGSAPTVVRVEFVSHHDEHR